MQQIEHARQHENCSSYVNSTPNRSSAKTQVAFAVKIEAKERPLGCSVRERKANKKKKYLKDRVAQPLEFPIVDTAKGWVLDPVPLLAALGAGVKAGQAVEHLAAAFHTSLAHATALAARRACEHAGVGTVVLAGGVFQNARLLASVASRLKAMGVEVLTATLLSPNDGAVSYGQAAIAAARLARGLGN